MEFKTSEVRKIFGLRRNNFQDWMERKFVFPSIKKSKKPGEDNVFSKDDLYRIQLFIYFLKLGLSRERAGEISYNTSFENVGQEPGCYRYLLIETEITKEGMVFRGTTIFKSKSDFNWRDELQGFIIVNLLLLKERVDNLIAK